MHRVGRGTVGWEGGMGRDGRRGLYEWFIHLFIHLPWCIRCIFHDSMSLSFHGTFDREYLCIVFFIQALCISTLSTHPAFERLHCSPAGDQKQPLIHRRPSHRMDFDAIPFFFFFMEQISSSVNVRLKKNKKNTPNQIPSWTLSQGRDMWHRHRCHAMPPWTQGSPTSEVNQFPICDWLADSRSDLWLAGEVGE